MQGKDSCIAVYSRKSKFTGKGESVGNQVELCREYIRLHYGEAAPEQMIVYEDEGFSGGNLNRPAFKRMMDAAKKHAFKAIIVYRLDRISRNISDFAGLIEELSRLNIAFVSIREQFDTSSPMGRAMMYIASVFSQLERETIAERIRDNMHELAKTGRWLGGVTPTGYGSESVKTVTVDGKTKKACKLRLIPEEAEIVKLIYDLYVETDSQTVTEAELMRRGIKTKNDRYYTRFSIKAILQNPVYLIADQDAYGYFAERNAELFSSAEDFDGVHGMMIYNRTDQEKGRATRWRPVSQWIVSVGQHPGLIPGNMWIRVQESLEQNKSKAYRKPRKNEALLTGLLYCSCGSRMYPKPGKRKTEEGKQIYTYVCKRKERSQRSLCSMKNANGNGLDRAVLDQLSKLKADQEILIGRLEQSRKWAAASRTDYEERLLALRREKADTKKKTEALVDSLTDLGDSTARENVVKRIEQLNQDCQETEYRIGELESLASQKELKEGEFDGLCRYLSEFRSAINEMTIEQKREAVRRLVYKVVWDGNCAHVVLFGAAEEVYKPHWGEDSK